MQSVENQNKAVVSLRRCESYDDEQVKEAVVAAVEDLGGFAPYISPGERVLLKVNLLMKKRPEEVATTHPAFVKALAELLIQYGAKVVIGDSPGGPFNEMMLRGIYRTTGMAEVAAQTGASLNQNYGAARRDNPEGRYLKSLVVADMLNDVDKVISVSKLKTHGMMTFTGAVKNMFGIVPGIDKAAYHMNMPAHDDFSNALVDICLCASPVLSFMDGIEGMEGAGPSGGTPRKVNVVLASDSPYHLDKAAVSIINLPFERVPTIWQSITRGLCAPGLEDVELRGGSIEEFLIPDYHIPETKLLMPEGRHIPAFVKGFVNKHVQPRPIFHHQPCVGCGVCEENCPAKVITMTDRKPSADLTKCIRCFCCQELCPAKAITIHRPMILRMVTK